MMPKKLVGLWLVLLTLALGALCVFTTKLYHEQEYLPSAEEVCEIVDDFVNGDSCEVFKDTEEAISVRSDMLEQLNYEKEFVELPNTIMQQVCAVLDKQGIPLKITTIINEYRAHKTVYDGLNSSQLVAELEGLKDTSLHSDTVLLDSTKLKPDSKNG